jgi:hypothetical protein
MAVTDALTDGSVYSGGSSASPGELWGPFGGFYLRPHVISIAFEWHGRCK